jgi:hypothetical protein
MGAEFNSTRLKAKSIVEARKEFAEIRDHAAFENGHGGYTGTFAEVHQGLNMTNKSFTTDSEARDWLEENAEKWGPALGVWVGEGDGAYIVVGATCSS